MKTMQTLTQATTVNSTVSHLDQFYRELLLDSSLQAQLRAAANPNHLYQLVVELAANRGYHFTQEELQAALAIELALNEHQLEANSNPAAIPPPCACCASFCFCF
jgi:predicted ribosomally synthesized peptide with nif11-like leader